MCKLTANSYGSGSTAGTTMLLTSNSKSMACKIFSTMKIPTNAKLATKSQRVRNLRSEFTASMAICCRSMAMTGSCFWFATAQWANLLQFSCFDQIAWMEKHCLKVHWSAVSRAPTEPGHTNLTWYLSTKTSTTPLWPIPFSPLASKAHAASSHFLRGFPVDFGLTASNCLLSKDQHMKGGKVTMEHGPFEEVWFYTCKKGKSIAMLVHEVVNFCREVNLLYIYRYVYIYVYMSYIYIYLDIRYVCAPDQLQTWWAQLEIRTLVIWARGHVKGGMYSM